MKKFLSCLLLLALLTSLSACRIVIGEPSVQPPATTVPTTPSVAPVETTVPVTEPAVQATTPATESTVPPTTAAPTTPSSDGSYLLQIKSHDELIFESPTYDSYFCDTVRQAGTYTIVEEKRDDEGNLWGKLKSGSGWVDITNVKTNNEGLVISAAELTYQPAGNYYEYGEKFGYATSVIFHAYEPLNDLQFYSYSFEGEGFEEGAPQDVLQQFMPGEVLVIHMQFYGDLTRYGIRFTTDDGVVHRYFLAEHGRNNALAFVEYFN